MKTKPIAISRYILITLFLCIVSSVSAQTLYALKIDRKIRLEAQDITASYQPRLVMGTDQALEFQSTVARYIVKKQSVERDHTLSPEAKYDLLKRLSVLESSEMVDVLESYRWEEYMRIKNQIQPIPEPGNLSEDYVAHEETSNK